ncbi:hypothetical protein CPB83DRAFT_758687 [Crepidotus variabilis]|uniref:Uncharacterized protein n=1 Tax=Crepidotus variabilis TaxID=179855 RepID=A0A9P6EP63_9AGAR|nr:hypothetical protein CPB83DRAFT_758687 [Crepidotus variabilis]
MHHQTFLHYTPPGAPQQHPQVQQHQPVTHVAPKDTQRLPPPVQAAAAAPAVVAQPIASTSAQPQPAGPVVAKGDWTKDLVQLAKTAELKKHALTLQLHTAHILSAHASLEQKEKALQDLLEQKNKLESERTRLLTSLREINEDRDRSDISEAQIRKECNDTRSKIEQLTNGDYAVAKTDVDKLRAELGQPPMPSLQETLEERKSQYLNERRLNGTASQQTASSSASASAANSGTAAKRPAPATTGSSQDGQAAKRPRGRPKGSKNRAKGSGDGAA